MNMRRIITTTLIVFLVTCLAVLTARYYLADVFTGRARRKDGGSDIVKQLKG